MAPGAQMRMENVVRLVHRALAEQMAICMRSNNRAVLNAAILALRAFGTIQQLAGSYRHSNPSRNACMLPSAACGQISFSASGLRRNAMTASW